MAVLVSVGRVAVGTHYPGDVLGGAGIGTLAALVFWARPVRGQLHALADFAGDLYDRAAARVLPAKTRSV
jgi:membrane-associated phospholipid phosphatase